MKPISKWLSANGFLSICHTNIFTAKTKGLNQSATQNISSPTQECVRFYVYVRGACGDWMALVSLVSCQNIKYGKRLTKWENPKNSCFCAENNTSRHFRKHRFKYFLSKMLDINKLKSSKTVSFHVLTWKLRGFFGLCSLNSFVCVL